MPPQRSRQQPDDSRSEASSTKEKAGTSTSRTTHDKNRRVGGNGAGASNLRDVVTAGSSNMAMGTSSTATTDSVSRGSDCTRRRSSFIIQINWSTFDPEFLHQYRHDYRLNTAAAFNKPYNQIVLQQSRIGRLSPTMAGRKEQRKQSKEQLANTVRKHFKSMGINENDVTVDFLYKVRYQGKMYGNSKVAWY
jgi:hypothetical protein